MKQQKEYTTVSRVGEVNGRWYVQSEPDSDTSAHEHYISMVNGNHLKQDADGNTFSTLKVGDKLKVWFADPKHQFAKYKKVGE